MRCRMCYKKYQQTYRQRLSIKKIIKDVIAVNKQMIEALLSNDSEEIEVARSAESAAWSAAESAARSAKSAARSAAVESAAWSADWSAARSAEYIKAYDYFADELLKLLRNCK